MTEGKEQRSTPMPWPLRIWPLTIVGSIATTALVMLAVFIHSDVTRVALPAIVGAVGTIGLAAVTVRLSIYERAHQDELRRADQLARLTEANHQQSIKAAEQRAAGQRERELELAAAVRQARRVAAFGGWEGSPIGNADTQIDTLTIVNGSDYPIFDIGLIGARSELLGKPINHVEWPPEMRLEGESLHVAVLLPGERHVFRGHWKWRKDFVWQGNTVSERKATYTWTDDQGRAWQRDGGEPPRLLPRPWVWMEFWGKAEYQNDPVIQP
jgi:hypothetical protein